MVVLAFFIFFFQKEGIGLGNYIVRRILNNNAFVSTNEQGQEIVVTGKGIVFQKSCGDRVPDARAEQVFQLSQENTSRFQELIARIPMNYMVLSEKIIQMAEEKLGKKLDESIYITITDHIYSAVQRYQNGLVIRNTMRWEIQRYYPDEYGVAMRSDSRTTLDEFISFAGDPITKENFTEDMYFSASQAAIWAALGEVQIAANSNFGVNYVSSTSLGYLQNHPRGRLGCA